MSTEKSLIETIMEDYPGGLLPEELTSEIISRYESMIENQYIALFEGSNGELKCGVFSHDIHWAQECVSLGGIRRKAMTPDRIAMILREELKSHRNPIYIPSYIHEG